MGREGLLPKLQILSNPVYDNASNTILIWGAAFKDNGPAVDSDGNLLSPDILDPSFSSDWLQCKPLPFMPRDSEAQYFQKGAMMEGDQAELVVSTKQQVVSITGEDVIPQEVQHRRIR